MRLMNSTRQLNPEVTELEVVTLTLIQQLLIHDLRLFASAEWERILLAFGGWSGAEQDVPGFLATLRGESHVIDGMEVPFLSAYQCGEILLGKASLLRLRGSNSEEALIIEPLGTGGQGTVFLESIRKFRQLDCWNLAM